MALSKTEIIKFSIPVFKEKGFSATCMADIANASGILKGSLYHHFDSKEALMEETLKYLRTYFIEKIFSIAYTDKLSFEKRLERLARKSEEQFLEGTGGCFMSMVGTETATLRPKFNQIIIGFFNDWKNAFIHLYKNVSDDANAIILAEKAIMLIEGSVLLMRIHNNPDYLAKAQKIILNEFKFLKAENQRINTNIHQNEILK